MTSATSTDTAVAQYSTAYNGESETHDETYAAEYDNPTAAVEPLLDAETVLASLIHQLEFYFSPSNLATDSFLLSQMDQARFVPVDLICSFRRVTALTSDRAMVLEAMRRCRVVQLDDTETLVKPSAKLERITIILRDIPTAVHIDEVSEIFNVSDCPAKPLSIRSDIDDTWFVTMENESLCTDTALWLASQSFRGQPIKCRVKSENLMRGFYTTNGNNGQYGDESYGYMNYYNPYNPTNYNQYGGYNDATFRSVHAAAAHANGPIDLHIPLPSTASRTNSGNFSSGSSSGIRKVYRATDGTGSVISGGYQGNNYNPNYDLKRAAGAKKKKPRKPYNGEGMDGQSSEAIEHIQPLIMASASVIPAPAVSIASPTSFPPITPSITPPPMAQPLPPAAAAGTTISTTTSSPRPVLNYASRVGSLPAAEVARIAAAAEAARKAKSTKPDTKEHHQHETQHASAISEEINTATSATPESKTAWAPRDSSSSSWRDRHPRKVIHAPHPNRYPSFNGHRNAQQSPASSTSTDTASSNCSTSSPSSPASSSSITAPLAAAVVSRPPVSFADLLKRQASPTKASMMSAAVSSEGLAQ